MKKIIRDAILNLVVCVVIPIICFLLLAPTTYKGQMVNTFETEWFRDKNDPFTSYHRKVALLTNVDTGKIVAIRIEEQLANDGYECTIYDEDSQYWNDALEEYYPEYEQYSKS